MMEVLKPLRVFVYHGKLELWCQGPIRGTLQMINLYLGTHRSSLTDTLSQVETTKVRAKVRAAVVGIE